MFSEVKLRARGSFDRLRMSGELAWAPKPWRRRLEPSPNGRRAKLTKKLILILLIIKSFTPNTCFASDPKISLPAKIKTELLAVANKSKNNFVSGACLLTIMFMLSYQAQVDQMPEGLRSQFRPQNLALNFASTYFMYFACQFFHELGHGLAKKIVTGCDFKIHLGKGSCEEKTSDLIQAEPLIDSKYLSLDGFDPQIGFNTAQFTKPGQAKKYTPAQKIFINLAGGISGILGYYLLRMAMFFVRNLCTQENQTLTQNLKNALRNSVTVDQIIVSQFFNMLVPMQNDNQLGGDAVKVWQELGAKDSSIKSVAEIQPYLYMLAFIALAFKQSASKTIDERHIADKILIGLANYFFQGFMQFKSA